MEHKVFVWESKEDNSNELENLLDNGWIIINSNTLVYSTANYSGYGKIVYVLQK